MRIEELDGKLEVVDFNEFQAYRIACTIEKDGVQFYEKLLSKIERPELKETFEYLIREEKEHVKFFEGLMNQIDDGNEQKQIVHCAKIFYKLYGDIFRSLTAS